MANDRFVRSIEISDPKWYFITKTITFSKLNILPYPSYQGNLIKGKAQLALRNWKNLLGDQKEDSLTSLEVLYLL